MVANEIRRLEKEVDLRYLILGLTSKGESLGFIPDFWELQIDECYDDIFQYRLKLLGMIILNAPYLEEDIKRFIEDYFKYEKRTKLIRPIKLITRLFDRIRSFILFITVLNGINHFFKFLPESRFISDLTTILFPLKEFIDYISSKHEKPDFLKYIEMYKKSFYLWLVRAGIELTKYPQTNKYNSLAVLSFKKLIFHVKNDIWGVEFYIDKALDFSEYGSERAIASILINHLFSQVTAEQFLKMIYKEDYKSLSDVLGIEECLIKETFFCWKKVPIPYKFL